MRIILQRAARAEVTVEGRTVGSIGKGLVLLAGIAAADDQSKLPPMAAKVCRMRIFPDSQGRFDLSLLDVQGGLLIIPQFTLFADTSKGRRPEFFGAMKPPQAEELFCQFAQECRKLGVTRVEQGIFGAQMQVSLVNDGPVTIWVEN